MTNSFTNLLIRLYTNRELHNNAALPNGNIHQIYKPRLPHLCLSTLLAVMHSSLHPLLLSARRNRLRSLRSLHQHPYPVGARSLKDKQIKVVTPFLIGTGRNIRLRLVSQALHNVQQLLSSYRAISQ